MTLAGRVETRSAEGSEPGPSDRGPGSSAGFADITACAADADATASRMFDS